MATRWGVRLGAATSAVTAREAAWKRALGPLKAVAAVGLVLAVSTWCGLPAPNASVTMHQVLGRGTDALRR